MTSRNSFRALYIAPYLHTFLDKLVRKLEPILAFIEEQAKRSRTERVWNSRTDSGKIQEYRERVQGATRLFEVSLVAVLYLLIELSAKINHPRINDTSCRVRVEVSHIKPRSFSNHQMLLINRMRKSAHITLIFVNQQRRRKSV